MAVFEEGIERDEMSGEEGIVDQYIYLEGWTKQPPPQRIRQDKRGKHRDKTNQTVETKGGLESVDIRNLLLPEKRMHSPKEATSI